MNIIIEKALNLWDMAGAKYHLVAARENAVYQITTGTNQFALRLHRQGYRTDQELWSELEWMAAVAQGGIIVPTPVRSTSGKFLHVIDKIQIDVLTWLAGEALSKLGGPIKESNRASLFQDIGKEMAKLHKVSDAWQQPKGFTRCAWNRDGLLGETPLWDRFWDNPKLSFNEKSFFLKVREKANNDLAELETKLDYGLIHADLVSANIMLDGDQLKLIDFDDGGFGFRIFDIATALLKHIEEDDYSELRTSLINGYKSVRPIDLEALDLFILLRAATYVGWNITRMDEDGSENRNERFVKTLRDLAKDYLVIKN